MVCGLIDPVNAMNRADVNGFLDFFFRGALREHHQGPAQGIVEDKDFRTDFHTGFAADAGVFVYDRYTGHNKGFLSAFLVTGNCIDMPLRFYTGFSRK
jgi:hypothetical protein